MTSISISVFNVYVLFSLKLWLFGDIGMRERKQKFIQCFSHTSKRKFIKALSSRRPYVWFGYKNSIEYFGSNYTLVYFKKSHTKIRAACSVRFCYTSILSHLYYTEANKTKRKTRFRMSDGIFWISYHPICDVLVTQWVSSLCYSRSREH